MINEKVFPNFWQAFLIIACWAITNLITWTVTTVMVYDHDDSILYQTIQVILIGINYVPYIVYLIRKTNIRIWNNFALPDFSTLLIIIIVTLLLSVVIRIPMDQPFDFVKSIMDSKIKFRGTDLNYKFPIIVITFRCVFFPIIEEILYRGLILEQFLKRYTPSKAILLSSLIFGFAHLNIERFVFISIGGIILGIFYYKTYSILVPSISHIIFNMALIFEIKYFELSPGNIVFYISVFFISILIIIYLLKKPMDTIKINELINKLR